MTTRPRVGCQIVALSVPVVSHRKMSQPAPNSGPGNWEVHHHTAAFAHAVIMINYWRSVLRIWCNGRGSISGAIQLFLRAIKHPTCMNSNEIWPRDARRFQNHWCTISCARWLKFTRYGRFDWYFAPQKGGGVVHVRWLEWKHNEMLPNWIWFGERF